MTGVDISPLDVKKLAYLLVDGYWQVSVVQEIDSTQTYLASKKPFHGEVIAAEFQSAGRGRLDRTFEAERSCSLLFSFYIEPQRNRDEWGWISLIAGIALERILNSEKEVFYTKWPNDILVVGSERDGKVAGILAEATSTGVIVGIGLNVAMTESELPVPTATSLALVNIAQRDRNYYLSRFLVQFASLLAEWEEGADLVNDYSAHSSTLGKKVEVRGVGEVVESGIAESIGLFGELVLDGARHIYSGDVIHLYT